MCNRTVCCEYHYCTEVTENGTEVHVWLAAFQGFLASSSWVLSITLPGESFAVSSCVLSWEIWNIESNCDVRIGGSTWSKPSITIPEGCTNYLCITRWSPPCRLGVYVRVRCHNLNWEENLHWCQATVIWTRSLLVKCDDSSITFALESTLSSLN